MELPPVKVGLVQNHVCQPPDPIGGPVQWLCSLSVAGPYDVVVEVSRTGRVLHARAVAAGGQERDCTQQLLRRRFHPATTCDGRTLPADYVERVPEMKDTHGHPEEEGRYRPDRLVGVPRGT